MIDEDSPLGPAGLYGASKIFCEKLVEAYAQRSGGGYSILRYGHVYGPGEEASRSSFRKRFERCLPERRPPSTGTALPCAISFMYRMWSKQLSARRWWTPRRSAR